MFCTARAWEEKLLQAMTIGINLSVRYVAAWGESATDMPRRGHSEPAGPLGPPGTSDPHQPGQARHLQRRAILKHPYTKQTQKSGRFLHFLELRSFVL